MWRSMSPTSRMKAILGVSASQRRLDARPPGPSGPAPTRRVVRRTRAGPAALANSDEDRNGSRPLRPRRFIVGACSSTCGWSPPSPLASRLRSPLAPRSALASRPARPSIPARTSSSPTSNSMPTSSSARSSRELLFAKKCGPGDPAAGDPGNGCHFNSSAVSGMALVEHAPVDCGGGHPTNRGQVGAGSGAQGNLQAVSLEMSRDYLTAPLFCGRPDRTIRARSSRRTIRSST